jgi:hypothetical protein
MSWLQLCEKLKKLLEKIDHFKIPQLLPPSSALVGVVLDIYYTLPKLFGSVQTTVLPKLRNRQPMADRAAQKAQMVTLNMLETSTFKFIERMHRLQRFIL